MYISHVMYRLLERSKLNLQFYCVDHECEYPSHNEYALLKRSNFDTDVARTNQNAYRTCQRVLQSYAQLKTDSDHHSTFKQASVLTMSSGLTSLVC